MGLGLALTGAGLGACGADPIPDIDYGFEPVRVQAEVLYAGDHLREPLSPRLAGSELVVIDQASDRSVHILDAESGELRASIGPVGEGPGEFLMPVATVRDGGGDVWVMDGASDRATRITPARPSRAEPTADDLVELEARPIRDAVRTVDGRWIVDGIFEEGRYALLEPDGARIDYRGNLPTLDGEPPMVAAQASWTALAAHPDLDRFVAAGRYFADVFFLDLEARIVGRAETPVRVEPDYLVDERRFLIFDDTPLAYTDVAASRDHVFGLFSGRTDIEFGQAQAAGRDVHVFDWDGRLVNVLRLDRDALAIEVDEYDRRLYAVELEPRPAIVRFALPESMRRP